MIINKLEKIFCLTSRGCFHSPTMSCSIICRLAKAILLGAIPILLWLLLFLNTNLIPTKIRPPISVWLLPRLDYLLFFSSFGLLLFSIFLISLSYLLTNHSNYTSLIVFLPLIMRCLSDLSNYQSSFLDILAWLPYGLFHYLSPLISAFSFLYFTGVNNTVIFAQCFGLQNFTAVLIQILFPTAPPWYRDINGDNPANYSMIGNPGGLARVDDILGTSMYKNVFNNSPLVFGAMPSLHSGFACIICIFTFHFSKRYGFLLSIFVMWQWWATMYLHHHYMVDLIGGASLSLFYYMLGRKYLRPIPNYPGSSKFYDLSSPPGAYKPIEQANIHDYQPMINQNSEEFIV